MTLANLRTLLVVARAYRVAGHEQHAQAALEDAIQAVDEMVEAQTLKDEAR